MQAYHGTDATFTEFDSAFFSKSSGLEQYGSGFYFTNLEDMARGYGEKVYDVELNLENPYEIKLGETSNDIFLSPKEVKDIIMLHPNIYAPCDADNQMNPLGDYSDKFWELNSESPYFKQEINAIVDKVIKTHFNEATLLNLDMFYECSAAPKTAFLEAVKEVTGHDGIVVKGMDNINNRESDIYVAWFSEQIDIQDVKETVKEKSKKRSDVER